MTLSAVAARGFLSGMALAGTNRFTATAQLPGGWAMAAGIFALLVSASTFATLLSGRRRWLPVVNLLGTIVHEAGHATVCLLTGGGVYRLEITAPDAGSVESGSRSRLSRIATSAAGYAMPTLAGLGAAALLQHGHAPAVLTLTVVVMLLLLVVARGLLTMVAVAGVGFLAFATLFWGPGWLQAGLACTEAWLLLTSELGGVAVLIAVRVRRRGGTDDAVNLARATHIPGLIWIAGWLFLIGWGLWQAAPILLAMN